MNVSPEVKRFLVGRARLTIAKPAIEVWAGDELPEDVIKCLAEQATFGQPRSYLLRLSPKGVKLCRALRDHVLGLERGGA